MGYPIGYDVCTWLCSNVLTNIAKRKRIRRITKKGIKMKNNKQQTVQELLTEIRKLSGKSNNSQLIAKLRKASEN